MSFLAPLVGAIAAAVVIPSLVALYFLKLRRRRMEVPSTLLWKKAIQDMQVNSPFQRLRNSLLLLLQLLILAALLFALARPTLFMQAEPGSRAVIVIDRSGSMSATDAPGGGTRLDEAKRLAEEVVDALSADGAGQAMVVSFAEAARVERESIDEHVRPFQVEVLIDRRGRMRRPVLEDSHHPLVVYHYLEQLYRRGVEPATVDGEPVDLVYLIGRRVIDERWSTSDRTFEG
ncbi:MAG: VWA domain-containing protein [Acidobacteriota bacterium]